MAGINKRKGIIPKIALHSFFILLSLCFIIPLWAIVSISVTGDIEIVNYGYRLIPKTIDFSAYRFILKDPSTILSAYKVTIITSFASAILFLIIGSMSGYALSRDNFKYRRGVTFFFFFTMLFNGGLVPTYILISKYLNLKNTCWVLILPLLVNVWNVFLMRTFFQQLPKEIFDSATIDGAGEFRIYSFIVLPLSKPVLATVGLLQLLGGWNSWYLALLYITDKELYPLQYLLQIMLLNISMILNIMQKNIAAGSNVDISYFDLPNESMRMAMCILAVGPMLLIFPFFQKYFSKGLTVGSVKG
ncbi:MAG TPA: sugar ABC transporter permease [Clostridiales bacterium]|nr:carbohydrate ABC transporter permease [Clostridia bacterium]HCS75346.1 sugar ABC transporter permease [Clostridiales bacterium]